MPRLNERSMQPQSCPVKIVSVVVVLAVVVLATTITTTSAFVGQLSAPRRPINYALFPRINKRRQQQQQQQRLPRKCTASDRDMETLHTWANSSGIEHSNLRLGMLQDNDGLLAPTTTKTENWGVALAHDTSQDCLILQVPAALILSSDRIQQELDGPDSAFRDAIDFVMKSPYQHQISHFYLWIKLLMEYEKQHDSVWYRWIQSLPSHCDTALTMDEIELDCLPPYAWALAQVERRHWKCFRKALSLVPTPGNQDTSGSRGMIGSPIRENERLLRWAFQVVFTRCWRYPSMTPRDYDRCDIVPVGDMFNHGPMNIKLDYDGDDNFVMYLAQDTPAGTPLYLSYGKPTNPYRLLVLYGFVDESMPFIYSQVVVSSPSQRHVDLGYDVDRMVFRTTDGAISNPVWDVILYSILEQQPDTQEMFYQAYMRGDVDTQAAMHDQYRLETGLTLRKHVVGVLQELRQLHTKMDSVDNTDEVHPRLRMIRRNNVFVTNVFAKVQDRLDQILPMELQRRKSASTAT